MKQQISLSTKKCALFCAGGVGLLLCLNYVWLLSNYTHPIWFIICSVILAFCYVGIWKKPPTLRESVFVGMFSVILSLVFIVGSKIQFNNEVFGGYTENYMRPMSMTAWLGVICWIPLVFLVIYQLYRFCDRKAFVLQTTHWNTRQCVLIWLAATVFIMICWSPYLFAFYPGVVVGDSLASIHQALGVTGYSNHYPVLYTLFIKLWLELGHLLGSYNKGVFLYTCVQYFLMAATGGYLVLWMIRKKMPWLLTFAVEMYFAFTRIFAIYAISMWKDPLFTAALLLFSLLLVDIVYSKGELLESPRTILHLLVLSFLIIFWRNNGLYLVIGSFLILGIVYRRHFRKVGLGIAGVVLASILIQGPVYDALGVEKDTAVESLAVPIQQLANVIVQDRELSAEQQEVLFQIFPEKCWKENYTPAIADSIKFHPEFNAQYLSENIGTFLKVWFQLLLPNLDAYVEAYLMDTIGFWQIGRKNAAGFYYFYIEENRFDICRVDLIKELTGIPAEGRLMQTINYISTGSLVWLMLLSVLVIWLRRQYPLLLGVVPALLLWLTIMVATPIAFSLRYIFLLAYGLPLILLLPFLRIDAKELLKTEEVQS